ARKWFTIAPALFGATSLVVNAPFGRFTPTESSPFLVDGIKSWIVMELVSPICFIISFLATPLSYYSPGLPGIFSPQTVLAACYLAHYTNRAILSPLRSPSRSKSHLIVPLCGICFNIINGSLMGAYMSSPFARIFLNPSLAYDRPSFYLGLAMFFGGLIGNIVHDEMLYDLRRKAKESGKKRDDSNEKSENGEGEHYSIPYGLLYEYVSYPNYLCEWIEWLGFALAAAPLPFYIPDVSAIPTLLSSVPSMLLSAPSTAVSLFTTPASYFLPNLTPPHIFLIMELLTMFPRAYNGHKWYQKRFGDSYPKNRKIVVPGLL
ncbi:hypothetical protein BD779DRAFT_1500271, partial [Infundibulicybe gibba]